MTAAPDGEQLKARIRALGRALGFAQVGFTGIALDADRDHLARWLALGRHGEMSWMARHAGLRQNPAQLYPRTRTIIAARMDYQPPDAAPAEQVLADQRLAYISRYALGRDYHRLLRGRLARLGKQIAAELRPLGFRAFTDSAPVLERALARNAGLGWIGKHTNLIHPEAGSWFFLGEIYTDLALPPDAPFGANHCGTCTRCLDVCPTQAIVAPYQLDARRCISYLTIELHGPIPHEFRRAIGNRIYGCDDCQLACPWNRHARLAAEPDFRVRHGLDASSLSALFAWDEAGFLRRTEGSAIRRVGHRRWLRNIAVALGNSPARGEAVAALQRRAQDPDEMLREHVHWALAQHAAAA
jgi:epoxyqueuosine reductase